MSAVAKNITPTQTEKLINDADTLLEVIKYLDSLNIRVMQFYSTNTAPEIWVHPSAELEVLKLGKNIITKGFLDNSMRGIEHKGVFLLWMELKNIQTAPTKH